jgi:hypothetical protein
LLLVSGIVVVEVGSGGAFKGSGFVSDFLLASLMVSAD